MASKIQGITVEIGGELKLASTNTELPAQKQRLFGAASKEHKLPVDFSSHSFGRPSLNLVSRVRYFCAEYSDIHRMSRFSLFLLYLFV